VISGREEEDWQGANWEIPAISDVRAVTAVQPGPAMLYRLTAGVGSPSDSMRRLAQLKNAAL
jgi:hypothetical protein